MIPFCFSIHKARACGPHVNKSSSRGENKQRALDQQSHDSLVARHVHTQSGSALRRQQRWSTVPDHRREARPPISRPRSPSAPSSTTSLFLPCSALRRRTRRSPARAPMPPPADLKARPKSISNRGVTHRSLLERKSDDHLEI